MDKLIVVTFDSEEKAYEGSKALQELHNDGSLALYAAAVVAKDADGKMAVKQAADEGPLGTAVGMLTGAMVGLIAGPEGMVLGMSSGALFGSMADMTNIGVDGEFLAAVDTELAAGKAAVVAECAENWVTPLDSKMESLGGTVMRRTRIDFVDDLIDQDVAQTRADFDRLQAEYDQASDETKAELQSKLDAARTKMNAAGERAKARAEAVQAEASAKVDTLKEQVSKSAGDAKAKLEAHMEEMKTKRDARVAKLKAAWESV